MIGLVLGSAALVSMGYLFHWREKRAFFHCLPYILMAGAVAAFYFRSKNFDLQLAGVMCIILIVLHLAVWLELRK